jgi:predicted RNase H-like HicB family nuclease
MKKSYIFRVELERDEEDGVWSAMVPLLPGCAVDAGTEEEALRAVTDMARMYVEVLIEDGRPVPLDSVSSGSAGAAVAIVA